MKTILVPVDFSDVSFAVVEQARQMAQAFRSGVLLFHVTEPEPELVGFEPSPVPLNAKLHDPEKDAARLQELVNFFAGTGLVVRAVNQEGDPVKRILETAAKERVDLIVLGSHGHGPIYNLLVGSVAAGVLKGATSAVVVVPAARG